MKYSELDNLYKNNEFRKIDQQFEARKFYLLRSISKKKTIKKFCKDFGVTEDLNSIFSNSDITEINIENFIRKEFLAKTREEMIEIETELNKMQSFDWNGSFGNNLGKHIVDNYVKKI